MRLIQLVSFVAAALTALLAIAAARAKSADQLVSIGDYKLHAVEAGSGAPTVVFESGLGEDVATWNDVQPAVAKFAQTVVYERAGLGKSQDFTGPRTIAQMTSDLHTLLQALQLRPPYVLVGHSLGGALIQAYAAAYPEEIAGLVLVDPEDGRLIDRLHSTLPSAEWDARQKAMESAMPQFSAAQKAELDSLNKSGEEMAALGPLPKVPMVLLTGTLKNPEFPGNPTEQDLKLQLHQEFLKQNPQCKQVLAPNSRHYIQNDAPQLVIDAIREVAAQARTRMP